MRIEYKSLFIRKIKNDEEFYYTEFGKGLNIIQGDNRVGKSTIAKSIFYSLGADIDLDLENSRGNSEDIITILELCINNEIFYLCRKNEEKKNFTYFLDQNYGLIVKGHKNKKNSTETEVLVGYANFSKIVLDKINKFGWIKFKNRYNKSDLINIYLSSFFEFFYIDQAEWGIDFVNFRDTDYIDRNDLPLLISIFFEKIVEKDFELLDNSNKYNEKKRVLEIQKESYKNLIDKLANDNNMPNTLIDSSKNFSEFFNFSKNQYDNLIDLKKLYFKKIMFDKVYKQGKANIKNMEYIIKEIFPVETSYINDKGEKIILDFDDIISFKSNVKNNINNQKEIKAIIASLDSQIKIIEEELKSSIIKNNDSLLNKFKNITLESINEEDLSKIFRINKSISDEIENLDLELNKIKSQIDLIDRKWKYLEKENNIFLSVLTNKLNTKFKKFDQDKEIKYFLNQKNFYDNKLTGTDRIFFSILQKLVFYEEIKNCSINLQIPIVVDTPNKEDLSQINWERMSEIVDVLSSKTQLLVMTTKAIDSKITFNEINLFNKKPRELLKNNDISKVSNEILIINEILLRI